MKCNSFGHPRRSSGFAAFSSRASVVALSALLFLALGFIAQAAESKGEGEWKSLFDGKSMSGWIRTDYPGGGSVDIKDQQILIGSGESLSGLQYTNTNTLPVIDYEIELEAARKDGSDFFCALTFPVEKNCATLVLGGWGGAVVGISSIDGQDASENETTKYMKFDKDQWFKIRVRVTKKKIQVWLNNEAVEDVEIEGRRISMRPGDIELCQPLGLATYQSSSAMKNIRLRKIDPSKVATTEKK